jgi:AcrR family transcriptional regulator
MPSPRRTSAPEIVRAGRDLLEADGLEQLTMQRVAQVVGVRAPSLYKHVRDRGELIRLIGSDVLAELGDRLGSASGSGDPRADIRAIAQTFRAFALQHPESYRLLFARLPEAWRADPSLNAQAVAGLMSAVASLAGEEDQLEAARMVVAWAHGFVSMELAAAFRLGGDVDAAYRYGIDRLLVAIMGSAGAARTPRSPAARRAGACTSDTRPRRTRSG